MIHTSSRSFLEKCLTVTNCLQLCNWSLQLSLSVRRCTNQLIHLVVDEPWHPGSNAWTPIAGFQRRNEEILYTHVFNIIIYGLYITDLSRTRAIYLDVSRIIYPSANSISPEPNSFIVGCLSGVWGCWVGTGAGWYVDTVDDALRHIHGAHKHIYIYLCIYLFIYVRRY